MFSCPQGEKVFASTNPTICDDAAGSGFQMYTSNTSCACLKFVDSNTASYHTAEAACSIYPNGRLFVANSLDKIEMTRFKWSDYWIGLVRDTLETFKWVDNSISSYNDIKHLFYPGNAGLINDELGNEDCVEIMTWQSIGLNDLVCSDQRKYICEIFY